MPDRFNIPTMPASIGGRLTIWGTAGYAIWQGLGIIHDGPNRFGGPSFAVLNLAPNPTLLWGLWLAAAGAVLAGGSITRRWWLKLAALIAIATWSVCFAVGSWLAQTLPTTAGTGYKTYVFIAWVTLVLVFLDERRPPRQHPQAVPRH